MKRIAVAIISLVLLGIAPAASWAKRRPPPENRPFYYMGVKYSRHGQDSILATDVKTGEPLWTRQIYVVKEKPGLERDVQACFISGLAMRGDELLIINEAGYQYLLNLETLEVRVLHGSLVIDRTKDFDESVAASAGKERAFIIKVGMEFDTAVEMLETFGAQHTVLQIMPKQTASGEYMGVESYGLGENPYLVVNYEQVNGQKIIRALDLYYRYGTKSDARNEWINVEQVDLNNIQPQAPDADGP